MRALYVGALTLLACAGAVVATTALPGAPTEVTPANVQDAILYAKPGDRITLAPGQYGAFTIVHKDFAPGITVDASKAQFVSIVIRQSSGITLEGGTVIGNRENTFGVLVDSSHDVTVRNMKISGARIALTFMRSQNVASLDNDFTGTRSDGVNVAMSQHVRVERNICRDFNPVPAVFDAKGKMLKDGDHPDCVQGWSRPEFPPTSDVQIIDNVASGLMQGVWFGDPGNGGYDRIVVRGNRLSLGYWHGIVLTEARDSEIIDNQVHAAPGARALNYPFQPIITWIRLVDGERNKACGNTVDVPRFSIGTQPC